MRTPLFLLAVLAITATITFTSRAADPAPPAASAAPVIEAAIADAAFLAGAWHAGDDEHGHTEEIWSAPRGNNIMGCFRWLKPDGSAMMVELLSIAAENNTLYLRLRHHDAKLVGWKNEAEANKPLEMVLKEKSDNRIVFHAANAAGAGDLSEITYARDADTLNIEITFTKPDRKPLRFPLNRISL